MVCLSRVRKKRDIDRVIKLLERHFIGATNETCKRYVFNQRNQEVGESFDSYLAILQSLVKTCDYNELQNSLLHDRIVIGILDNTKRKMYKVAVLKKSRNSFQQHQCEIL